MGARILLVTMVAYLVRRFLFSGIALLVLVTFVFVLSRSVPGDPAMFAAGTEATAEQIEKVRKEFGLDKDQLTQYVLFIKGLLRGDLGRSMYTRRPVLSDLVAKLPASIELTLAAVLLGIAIGTPLAIMGGTKPGSVVDHISRLLGVVGVSMPVFWYGLVLQIVFYGALGWFAASGRLPIGTTRIPHFTGFLILDAILAGDLAIACEAMKHLILPALALSQVVIALVVRMLRSSLLEVMSQNYIVAARAKGIREARVILKHAVRNALIPVVTLLGVQIGLVMSGAILTEAVFNWPGLGTYAYKACVRLDYPAMLGVTLLIGIIFLVLNSAVDITAGFLDPKVVYE